MAGTRPHSRRPQSKRFLHISLDNAYAQLGVSPLAPTADISTLINKQLAQARRNVLAKANRAAGDPDEKEQLRLQRIDSQIGDAKRRKAYDEANPQNILLTVQPSASERAWTRSSKAGFISEWLREEYDRAVEPGTQPPFLPTTNCFRLWAPAGVDEHTLKFLAHFMLAAPAEDRSSLTDASTGSTNRLTLHDLEQALKEE